MTDEEGFPVLSVMDPARCSCFTGTCTRPATVDGLCDRCYLEYAALKDVHHEAEET